MEDEQDEFMTDDPQQNMFAGMSAEKESEDGQEGKAL
jgi:hypothetical protein